MYGTDFPTLLNCLLHGPGKLLWPEKVIRKRGGGSWARKFIAYTATVHQSCRWPLQEVRGQDTAMPAVQTRAWPFTPVSFHFPSFWPLLFSIVIFISPLLSFPLFISWWVHFEIIYLLYQKLRSWLSAQISPEGILAQTDNDSLALTQSCFQNWVSDSVAWDKQQRPP